jgi:hypothetical protein
LKSANEKTSEEIMKMSKTNLKKSFLATAILIIGIVISVLVLANPAQAITTWKILFTIHDNEHDKIVAYVNEEPITIQELELSKNARLSSQSDLDIAVAYLQALNGLIRHRILVQEALQQGITVDETELRSYFMEIQQQEKSFPELAEMHEQQREVLGLTPEQYEDRLLLAYKEGILVEKLHSLLESEAPGPTDTEIDMFLKGQPGRNVLVIIPLTFDDSKRGHQVYQEILALSTALPADQFEIALATAVFQHSNLESGTLLHQKFIFDDENELPDYARAALGQKERTVGIFERQTNVVVYYVLKSTATSPQEARERAYRWLSQVKSWEYVEEVEKRLIEQAKVEYVFENLPDVVIPLIADSE